MKIDPITAKRPTNADLGRGVNQLHECLEGLKGEHARRLTHVERDLRAVKDALGVGEKKKKVAGTQSTRAAWWRTFIATTSSITAVAVAIRVFEALWPALKTAAVALFHAISAGRL